jgi:hypothetical protein
MDYANLQAQLELAAHGRLLVCVESVDDFPGYVRSVYLFHDGRVRVEYEVYGLDEGGAYYEGQFATFEEAAAAVEFFIATPSPEWGRLPIVRIRQNPRIGVEKGHRALGQAVQKGIVPVPEGATFALQGSSYWKEMIGA